MTTIEDAPKRIILSTGTTLERNRNSHVLIIDASVQNAIRIPLEDWTEVSNFFQDINNAVMA